MGWGGAEGGGNDICQEANSINQVRDDGDLYKGEVYTLALKNPLESISHLVYYVDGTPSPKEGHGLPVIVR